MPRPSDQAALKPGPPALPNFPPLDPTTPIPPPVITLTKSHLRLVHPSDAPAMTRAANSPAVAKYMTNRFASPYTIEDAYRWIAFASAFKVLPNMNICDPTTDTCIGGIGIKTKEDVEARCFEIGYWLGEESWGKGIMSEVVPAYVKWVFETFPEVIRLEAVVFEGNDASARLLKKAGFVHEGTRRKAGVKAGRVFDIMMFGLLREAWCA
ncbi:acyl-CoA N-acyltransferase [Parathielavia appendiculata]|uniref:Acyl-CoA N-acyltransferase n=1 Tax=Parathielavia appendiculata TaxID=2587402 RepID=A0AAN6U913_9PEZI|nr:acyl-CoA N-acyltransferase [Parathielavia appendiculata]